MDLEVKDEEYEVKSMFNEEEKKSIKEHFGIDVDSKVFSPVVDYAFKRIFTADEKRSKIALMDFVNSVLEFEGEELIVEILVVNAEIPVDIEKQKKSVFDIRAKLKNGEQIIIEMQTNRTVDFLNRSEFLISKTYANQEIAGTNYNNLKKAYLIAITNFTLLEDKEEIINDYKYRDKNGKDLTGNSTIVFIELEKIEKTLEKNIEEMTNVEYWCIFFRYVTDNSKKEILKKIIERKDGVKMAMSVLNEISKSEKERIQYENELFAELDYNSGIFNAEMEGRKKGIEEGIEKGRIEARRETALKMLDRGLDDMAISEFSGLSLEEVKVLRRENM